MAAAVPVPPANVMPVLMPAQAPPVPKLMTLTSYFHAAGNDPYGGDYTTMMQAFSHNNQRTPEDILHDILSTNESFPTNLLGIYETEGMECGQSLLLSGVRRYPRMIGIPSRWDDKVFAFAGDVEEGTVISVNFPDDAFDPAGGGTVVYRPSTSARIDELLAAAPDAELLGPFVVTDAQVRRSSTRNMMYVPPRYVPIVAARRLTPRQLWTDLVGAIRADGNEVPCAALVNWVALALVRPIAGEPGVVHKEVVDVPLADRELNRARKRVLHAELPDLRMGTGDGVPADNNTTVTAQLVQFVGQLVQESRQARVDDRDRADEKRAPKTPSAFFGEDMCRHLCIVCDVDTEGELPAVWKAIAGAGKKDRAALEHALNNTAHGMGIASMVPIATPDLTKKLIGLRLAGDDVNNLGEGVQPFAIVIRDHGIIGYTTSVEEETVRQRNAEYDILAEGSVSTTLQDVAKISTTTPIKVPTDYTHLRAVLQAYGVLLTTILGGVHPLAMAYIRFVTRYSNEEVTCRGQLQTLFPGQGPGRLLRFLQLHLVTWFRKVRTNGRLPPVPPFEDALDNLCLHLAGWAPELPRPYITLIAPPQQQHPPKHIPGPAGGSQVSGLTSGGSESITKTPRQLVTNLNRQPKLIPFGDLAVSMKLNAAIAKAGGPPPTINKAGVSIQMCLSYHVRGSCWNSCPRNADHAPHTTAEDLALIEWCTKAFAT
jgi:hypothetical protein